VVVVLDVASRIKNVTAQRLKFPLLTWLAFSHIFLDKADC